MSSIGTQPDRPWSVQVELVEGCQRRCQMCGIGVLGLAPDEYNYMEPALARRIARMIARQWGGRPRVEFAMHGEPLLHPKVLPVLTEFRAALPQTSLTVITNGLELIDRWAAWARDLSGRINVLAVDLYKPYGDGLRREIEANPAGWAVLDLYADGAIPWRRHSPGTKAVILIDDIMAPPRKAAQRRVTNQGGNSGCIPPVDEPLAAVCTRPFRELAIRWDGKVGICCDDWRLECYCGNAAEQDLAAIWRGPTFVAARRLLRGKHRAFAPCRYCDVGSGTRPGLLPHMGPASEQDLARVCQRSPQHPRRV